MLIDRIKELNDSLYRALGEFAENASHIKEEANLKVVENNIFELYKMDYALIRGSLAGIDNQVLELGLKKYKTDCEYEIQKAIVTELSAEKKSILVPADLPKRWWQRRARPNTAKILAERELDIDVSEYYDGREKEIELRELRYAEERGEERIEQIYNLLWSGVTIPRSKRKRRKLDKQIQTLAYRLKTMYETMQTQEESQDQADGQPEPENVQIGSDEPPTAAAELL